MDPVTLLIIAQAAAAPAANQVWVSVVIALIGGGAGLKLVEKLLDRPKSQIDEATTIRGELRTEVNALRAELRNVEAELDRWRGKFYRLVSRIQAANVDLDISDLLDGESPTK